MAWPRRHISHPRAQGALAALVLHGVAWALVWPALNTRPAAAPPERGPALVYLSAPTVGVEAPTVRTDPRPAVAAPRRAAPPLSAVTRPGPEAAPPAPAPTLLLAVAATPAAPLPHSTPLASAPHSGAVASAPPSAAPAVAAALPARPLPGNALPAYPEAAREDGLQGRVRLQLQIDAQGRVESVQWLQRSGIALLDLAARDAARGWRYEPARVGGEAVASSVSVAIRFQLDQPVSSTLLASQ
ncbi:energy transducer TonB [Ideonella alba]|uniref:Energy transducer TonB n=1 Tax=Ideonella alba TaxID=2824118 RepID=A0A940YF05_9BURK|nr:energy transducer TonB [Ideonella alba]MBQ0932978.1 energy transducer TonB [Ideonella alba]